MKLDGITALVTGGNRGIGQAIVAELSKHPLDTILVGVRSLKSYEAPSPQAGGVRQILPIELDLSSKETIERSHRSFSTELDRVDLLINNAGLLTGGLLEEQDLQDIYAMFQVNLVGLVHLTALILPSMLSRGHGKIVNNASISGYAYFPAASTYAASKAGVVAFTESLRRELAGTGISAMHLVTPGVETDMFTETERRYGRYTDTSNWARMPAEEWAKKVVKAITSDLHILGPGGKTALAKLASRGPAYILDAFSRKAFSRRKT